MQIYNKLIRDNIDDIINNNGKKEIKRVDLLRGNI